MDSKYSNEKPGRAGRKTCLDQYKANKASNANGGLKWLQRGGGYYSPVRQEAEGRGVDLAAVVQRDAGHPSGQHMTGRRGEPMSHQQNGRHGL